MHRNETGEPFNVPNEVSSKTGHLPPAPRWSFPWHHALEEIVTEDITTSTVWTSDNTYNLQGQIYVKAGATLTIEAGTVVASSPTKNGSGSLAVCRGAQINVQGLAMHPSS